MSSFGDRDHRIGEVEPRPLELVARRPGLMRVVRLEHGRQLAARRLLHEIQPSPVRQLERRGDPPDRVVRLVEQLDEDRPAAAALVIDRQPQAQVHLHAPFPSPRGEQLEEQAHESEQGRHGRDDEGHVGAVGIRQAGRDVTAADHRRTGAERQPGRGRSGSQPAALAGVGHEVAVVVDVELVGDAIAIGIEPGCMGATGAAGDPPKRPGPERNAASCAGSLAAVHRAGAKAPRNSRVAVADLDPPESRAGAHPERHAATAAADHHRAPVGPAPVPKLKGHHRRRWYELEAGTGASCGGPAVRRERDHRETRSIQLSRDGLRGRRCRRPERRKQQAGAEHARKRRVHDRLPEWLHIRAAPVRRPVQVVGRPRVTLDAAAANWSPACAGALREAPARTSLIVSSRSSLSCAKNPERSSSGNGTPRPPTGGLSEVLLPRLGYVVVDPQQRGLREASPAGRLLERPLPVLVDGVALGVEEAVGVEGMVGAAPGRRCS